MRSKEAKAEYRKKYYAANREATLKQMQKYNTANREAIRTRVLKKNYGLPLEVYNTLIDGQSFQCAICHAPDFTKGKPLYVDHCHKTGWVRGLLCYACNTGLGNFADDPERLQRAAEYLCFHSREGSLKVGLASA